MAENPENDEDLDQDEEVDIAGGGLPSFSQGGLPSFSGNSSSASAAWLSRKSPTLLERASPGPTPGGSATAPAAGAKRPLTPERQVGKKSKRELDMSAEANAATGQTDRYFIFCECAI